MRERERERKHGSMEAGTGRGCGVRQKGRGHGEVWKRVFVYASMLCFALVLHEHGFGHGDGT